MDSAMIEKAEYPNFHTFEEAVQFLAQGNSIDYEVRIGRHTGALMTSETWLESVHDGGFIDYDGMGNEVAGDGTILGEEPGNPGWIKPSESDLIRPETKYILWYNK